MTPKRDNEMNRIKRLVSVYNLLFNLLWSGLSFVPIIIFCYTWIETNLLLLFLGLSLLPVFLSHAAIGKLQISGKAVIYKKLGVAFVQHISQNGVFINYLIRKSYPGYKVVRHEKKSIKRLLKQTYVFEKFHLVGFVFFGFISVYAFGKSLHGWALLITITNLFFNIYPILLQQYIRVKLALYQKKGTESMPLSKKGFTKYWLKCMG